MLSRSICVVANGRISFFMAEQYSIMSSFMSIHLQWMLRLFPCFGYHIKCCSEHGCIVISRRWWFPSDTYTGVYISGSYGSSIFNFWGPFIVFSVVTASIYNPTNGPQGLTFLHIPLVLFMPAIPNWCELLSHCGFDCISPMISVVECWTPFQVPGPFTISHQDWSSQIAND